MDFMDIRKRIFTFPEMGKKAYFVAVPTSSGTGSECTPFAIITDKETGIKWPLADYALLPNMAIVDADNCMTAPRGLTAASGIDVMTHAIESYVSIMASDYTKGLSERAAKLVFENLPSSFTNGAKDPHAREEMHNASCMAGMAFANAFLGLNHSMAHKLGAFHHLPHGIANAVILTRVMRYNAAEAPVKMGTFSQYPYPNALHNYAEMAKYCGIEGKDDKEVFENFKNGSATAEDMLQAVLGDLTQMPNEYDKAALASTLWSSLGEDNAMGMIESLAGVQDSFGDVAGAAQQAQEAASDSFAVKSQEAMRELQGSIEPLGEPLLNIATNVAGVVKSFAEWFAGIGEGGQTAVLAIATIAAAIGPVLSRSAPSWTPCRKSERPSRWSASWAPARWGS